MLEVSVDELDVGMRVLHPRASKSAVQADVEAAKSADFIRRRPEPGQNVHVIHEPLIGFSDFKIPVARMEQCLIEILPRIERFSVEGGAWSTSEEKAPLCFGFGPQLFLRVEKNLEGFVSHIWYDSMTEEPEELAAFRKALEAVDGFCPSLIADYWTKDVGLVSDLSFMKHYMQHLVAVPEPPKPWIERMTERFRPAPGPKRAKARKNRSRK